MRVSELKGAALDWAVAKIEVGNDIRDGRPRYYPHPNNPKLICRVIYNHETNPKEYELCRYSTDWSQGGPIIEREDISFRKYHNPKSDHHGTYYAKVCRESGTMVHWKGWGAKVQTGPTPLIAAMRCYVASKLGDEIEIPKELL